MKRILLSFTSVLKPVLLMNALRYIIVMSFFFCPDILLAQEAVDKKLTLSFNNISLKDAFREIETAAVVVISYVDDDFDAGAKVNGQYSNKPLSFILSSILDKYDLNYKHSGNKIFIIKKQRQRKNGILTGKVIDGKNSEPLIGVLVKVDNTGAQSDDDGTFKLELPVGNYRVELNYTGYEPVSSDITIREQRETNLAVKMNEDKSALNEVVVTDRMITGTNMALISEIRNAQSIVSGISREQISRSQDRDAAEVVRRIPGVSVIQNRFIVIRGLPQRYNTVMLNNATAPSFEADSRAFSFDIIPSNLIDRVMIYKTAVPELQGDFAGGVVKVYTTSMPAKNSFNVSYKASVRPNTAFRSFYEQPQGKYAWLGYDDGTYAMPENVPSSLVEKPVSPNLFNSNWDAHEKTAPIDHRINVDFARRMVLSDQVKFGVVGGISYANTYQSTIFTRHVGPIDDDLDFYAYHFSEQIYNHDIRVNGLLNLAMDINNRHHIDLKNFYTHLGESSFLDRRGIAGPGAGDGTGLIPNQYIRQMILTNSFRDIFSSQLNGSHDLFSSTRLKWLLGYSSSHYDDPDQRRRTQLADFTGDENGAGIWREPVSFGASNIMWGRMYFKLPEEIRTLGLDIEQPISIGDFTPVVKAGIYLENKARSFSLRTLGLAQRPGDTVVTMNEARNPADRYTASNDLKAGYLAFDIPFLKKFKLYGGLRVEDNHQQLHSEQLNTVGVIDTGFINLDLHNLSLLPSANLSYHLTENKLIRAAFAKTLNRPEFREVAPFYYFDLVTFSTAFGNSHLEPQADIYNYDLRYEWYPAPGEMVNIGGFYKKFINPVEFVYYQSTAGNNSFQWENAESAVNYGAEIDLMISLARLTKGRSAVGKNIARLSLLFNGAYIFSNVRLRSAAIQDKNRRLYGQSPYTINAALSYTHEAIGSKLNLAYNVIGKRIIFVGNQFNPDVYELPRHSLDLTFSQRLGKKLELTGGIQNILNSRHLQVQDNNGDAQFDISNDNFVDWKDNTYLSYYSGTYYTLGFGFRL